VRDDGMWLEGASGYHFFTIDGLWPLAEAARHCGIDLYTPRFKSMFDGPLNLAMPDLRLPNFNDSGVVELSSRSDQYELAYARWKDPNYLSLISANDRKGRLALLYGAPDLKASDAAPEVRRRGGSRNLPPSGFAILEQATNDDASWLCLKYGPHGGGHGHFDKNHFILWSHGAILMPDAGTHAYGSPLHSTWDKTSLAHNTLTVDEKSQDPSEGKCLAFGTSNGVDFAVTDAGPIYKDANVRFVRSVAMINPNLIVVIDQIHADAEHTLDLAVHVSGAWTDVPAGKPWPAPQVPGYRVLEDLQTRPAGELVARAELAPNHHTCITLAGNESSEIITGTGVGETTKDRVPIAIFRRHAKSTTYVWAIALDGTAQKLDSKPLPNEGIEVRVNGSVRIVANPNGDPLFEVRKD
jgi:hypothetical protein